jgi:hypothetical protein
MPAQHRFGPRDEQCPAPTREPATSQDPEQPIGVPQPGPGAPTLIDEELLAKAKILRNQGGSRLKDTCDCHSQPGQHLSILSPKLSQGEFVTDFTGRKPQICFCALQAHPLVWTSGGTMVTLLDATKYRPRRAEELPAKGISLLAT